MPVQVFNHSDDVFLQWMKDNPTGFVVNTERRDNSAYTVLHQSGCSHIAGHVSGFRENAFTGHEYIKVLLQQRVCSSRLVPEIQDADRRVQSLLPGL